MLLDKHFGAKWDLIRELIELSYEVKLEPQTNHIRIVGRDIHHVDELLTCHGMQITHPTPDSLEVRNA